MIIHGLSAQDVLKYHRLELANLPAKGLIAISGPNESGKSTIGETICFALFGRTFSLSPKHVGKVIRWGTTRCSVTLDFSADGDDVVYRIARSLDDEGSHGVKLLRRDGDEPLARGNAEVQDSLREITGFGYEEFIESFYLPQREITTPHPHSSAVKTMAGVTQLENVDRELRRESENERSAIAEIESQKEELEGEIEDLRSQDQLAELEQEREETLAAQEHIAARVSELGNLLGQCDDASNQAEAVTEDLSRARRGGPGFFGLLLTLAAVVAWAAWALLTQAPESSAAQQVSAWLTGVLPEWKTRFLPWTMHAAAVLTALALLFIVVGRSRRNAGTAARRSALELGRDIEQIRRRGEEIKAELFGDELQDSDEDSVQHDSEAAASHPVPDSEAESAAGGAVDSGTLERFAGRYPELRRHFDEQISHLRDSLNSLSEAFTEEAAVHEENLRDLTESIEEEEQRRRRIDDLQTLIGECDGRLRTRNRRIAVRSLACELLGRACRELAQKFNQDIGLLVGRTLPLLTDGSYEHLQIDEKLNVRLFSGGKRDFLTLDEISSGTQRQVMLAVRLALSQGLVKQVIRGRQFIFLDEPFAFFDDTRTRKSLETLPGLSDDISQLWIIGQQFPDDVHIDLRIECSPQSTELTVPAS